MGSVRSSWNREKISFPDDTWRRVPLQSLYRVYISLGLEFLAVESSRNISAKGTLYTSSTGRGRPMASFHHQLKGKKSFPRPSAILFLARFVFFLFLPFLFCYFSVFFFFYDHFWDGLGIWCWLFFSFFRPLVSPAHSSNKRKQNKKKRLIFNLFPSFI